MNRRQSSRLRCVCLPHHFPLEVLRWGNAPRGKYLRVDRLDIPDTAQVVDTYYSESRRAWVAVLEDDSFDEVTEGEVIPFLDDLGVMADVIRSPGPDAEWLTCADWLEGEGDKEAANKIRRYLGAPVDEDDDGEEAALSPLDVGIVPIDEWVLSTTPQLKIKQAFRQWRELASGPVVVILNPDTAVRLAESPEIRDFMSYHTGIDHLHGFPSTYGGATVMVMAGGKNIEVFWVDDDVDEDADEWEARRKGQEAAKAMNDSLPELPTEPVCKFAPVWQNLCGKPVFADGLCATHYEQKCCRCGKQAVRECDYASSLVCGAPLCADCNHGH